MSCSVPFLQKNVANTNMHTEMLSADLMTEVQV